MPPFVTRKRERSASPLPTPPAKKQAVAKPKANGVKKPTLFDAADDLGRQRGSAEKAKKLLSNLDDDESSLSEADSDDFEDVQPSKRQKNAHSEDGEDDEDEDDDEMQWESAIPQRNEAGPSAQDDDDIGDVTISVNQDGSYVEPMVSGATGKKGPSKRERQVRVNTHCLHVQALMWHNTVRNSWLNDKEVQSTLVDGLAEGVKREVLRWKAAMGILSKEELAAKNKATAMKNKASAKGKKGKQTLKGRDWAYDAEHAEQGAPDLSHGDPLLRLLKVLTAYWRKRFTITTPGLRKQGVKPLRRLRDDIRDWEKDHNDFEQFGERIESLAEFRKMAREYEGSRDVGGQLFVALLRGLDIEARLVANLQPAGFGWSKAEEADPKLAKKAAKVDKEESLSDGEVGEKENGTTLKTKKSATPKQTRRVKDEKPTRKSSRGIKAEPIDLDNSDSPLSSPPSDNDDPLTKNSDDESIIDVTPAIPKPKANKKYDRDLAFPIYWAEVRSPVSNKYIPVDPIVLSTIASNEDLLSSFEPRGKRAERAKQVICYTIAFNADNTAKDVTVRYLKKHQLPGKTKGIRVPIEKIAIRNRKGKVKRYEHYDWFRTLMRAYDVPEKQRTAADDLEDQTDLKPFKPAAAGSKETEKESLQWYKQSADYVLEQHLRREEALLPGSEPVREFTAGKGDKAVTHPVFLRDDVVTCKTVESWHKEGREIKSDEHPIKHVPMRAVTLIRKREMEDAIRETGEKLKQGLYWIDQTDWIIPPPLGEDRKIPKNAYGNMDVYVSTMVPAGAIHVPLKGTAKLCRRMGIDHAEACTGFEFGKQRAVPVLTGVVVARENERVVRDAWKVEQAEVRRKEDVKRTAAALGWWRKMVMGLRIVERMQREYRDTDAPGGDVNPFINRAMRDGKAKGKDEADPEMEVFTAKEEEMAGGFFQPGHEEEEAPRRPQQDQDGGGGGFMEDNAANDDEQGGGFLIEDDPADTASTQPNGISSTKPKSLQTMHFQFDGADDKSEESEVDDAPPPLKSAPKAKRQTKPKPTPKRQPRAQTQQRKAPAKRKSGAKAISSGSEAEETSEEAESASEADDASSPLSDVSSDIPAKGKKAMSPKVVVTPRKTGGTTALKGRAGAGRGRRSTSGKATPTKSPYFSNQGVNNDDGENEGIVGGDGEKDVEEEESEAEVVKPRATTARTRSRR